MDAEVVGEIRDEGEMIESALVHGAERIVDEVGAEEEREGEDGCIVLQNGISKRVGLSEAGSQARRTRTRWEGKDERGARGGQGEVGNRGTNRREDGMELTCSSASTEPIPSVSITRNRDCDPSRCVDITTLFHSQIPRVHDAIVEPTWNPLRVPRRI